MNARIIICAVSILASLMCRAEEAYKIGQFTSIMDENVYKLNSDGGKPTYCIEAGWSNGSDSYLVIEDAEIQQFVQMLKEMKGYIDSHDSDDSNDITLDIAIPRIGKSVCADDLGELGKKDMLKLKPDESKIRYCGKDNITGKEKIEFRFESERDPKNPDRFSNYNYGYISMYSPQAVQQLIDIFDEELNFKKSGGGLSANTIKRYGRWRDDEYVISYTTAKGKKRYYIQTGSNVTYIDMDESDSNYGRNSDEYLWFSEDKLAGVAAMLKDLLQQCKQYEANHVFQGAGRADIYSSGNNDFIPLKPKTMGRFDGQIVGRFGNTLDIMRGHSFNGNMDIYYQQHKDGDKWLRLEIKFEDEDGDEDHEILTIEIPYLEKLVAILESITKQLR